MLKHACMFWYPAQVIGPFHKSLELKTNDKKITAAFCNPDKDKQVFVFVSIRFDGSFS